MKNVIAASFVRLFASRPLLALSLALIPRCLFAADAPSQQRIVTAVASDLRGHLIGIICDAAKRQPVADAVLTLSGQGRAGPWQAKAATDGNGMFSVDVPLQLSGAVKIVTRLKNEGAETPAAESQVNAVSLSMGLTPVGARQGLIDLGGKWKFSLDPPEGFWQTDFDDLSWKEIKVPSQWEMEGFHSEAGVGGYRLRFKSPPGDGRVKLRFESVQSGAEVWVNGRIVAIHEGGFTPFEADISDAVKEGDNLLALRVREHTVTSDELDHMSSYSYFYQAGIFRPVYLFRVPETHVGALEITTTFDKDYRDATMHVRAVVWNESATAFRGKIGLALTESDSRSRSDSSCGTSSRPSTAAASAAPLPTEKVVARTVSPEVEVAAWGRAAVEISLPVKSPKTWTAEQPNLYSLSVNLLGRGNETVETFSERTGFRQTEIRGSQLLVNGKPIKIRGACHLDTHPLLGRAVTAELERQDLQLMKDANLNAVRATINPPLPALLDLTDEMGLYEEAEASFCWTNADDPTLTPRIIQLTAELLARDRNHPSVTWWSVCNESPFGFGFQRSREWVRRADPSRPTSVGDNRSLKLATFHNPMSLERMRQTRNIGKPLIFDESLCIFQGIWGDVAEMWVDPGQRDYYIEPLLTLYDAMMRSKTTQGSMIWCFSDEVFCVPGRGFEYGRGVTRCFFAEGTYLLPGRGLVGDGPSWGFVDGWRRKKPEYWLIKKLHSPVRVKETPLPLPATGEPIRVAVENQYDYHNLTELKIVWALGKDGGAVHCDVPARSCGTIEVNPNRAVKDGELLQLKVENKEGMLVDDYRIPLGHEPSHAAPWAKCEPGPLRLGEETSLEGTCTTITGKDFQLAVDRETGLLRRGVGKGQTLLLELPAVHILPTSRSLQPLPNRLDWTLEKIEAKPEGENVRLSIRGSYPDFKGGYELIVTPAGQLSIDSSFQYSGKEMLAHEVGLRFSVPRGCDVLDWDRKAEWRVYPADHIGRPRGTAIAFPKATNVVPPAGNWSEDISPMGSNDFRSTKRHIYWAGIHYPAGPGVAILSDGRQHVRANVETDRISVYVNDWFGGTGTGWLAGEWTVNYGQGKRIRTGDTIATKARLRIVPRFPDP